MNFFVPGIAQAGIESDYIASLHIVDKKITAVFSALSVAIPDTVSHVSVFKFARDIALRAIIFFARIVSAVVL